MNSDDLKNAGFRAKKTRARAPKKSGAVSSFVLDGGRFLMSSFGLSKAEAEKVIRAEKKDKNLLKRIDAWRETIGLPAKNSPLVRGYLLSMAGVK